MLRKMSQNASEPLYHLINRDISNPISMMIVIGWVSPAFAIRRDVVWKVRESWREQTFYYRLQREPRLAGPAIVWSLILFQNGRSARFAQLHGGALGTLSLVLGVCAFSAVGAEQPLTKQNALCSGNSPECYAKTHHNPVKGCKQVMDEKANFRHVWQESEAQSVFDTYLWHDEKKRTIRAFGQRLRQSTGWECRPHCNTFVFSTPTLGTLSRPPLNNLKQI